MVWLLNGSKTLTVAGDDLDITDLTALIFNVILVHIIASGNTQADMTVDDNSNTDYAFRGSAVGNADTTFANAVFIDISNGLGSSEDRFVNCYGCNISGEEKLFQSWMINIFTTGPGIAPDRNEVVGKVDTTTNSGQFTRVDVNNDGSGNYDVDSNLLILSTD